MKKELVYCSAVRKSVQALRQSNTTLLVANDKLPDSDSLVLEDQYGHRYIRQFSLDVFLTDEYFLFQMI